MADFRLGRLKFKWKGDWAGSTAYVIDDIAKFGGNSYVCITNHTSHATEDGFYAYDLPSGTEKWSLHTEGLRHRGDWATTQYYRLNDVVKYGNTQYRCTTGHTSAATFNAGNFAVYFSGFEYESTWSNTEQYQIGDVVTHGGYSYVATADNVATNPTGLTTWKVITTGFKAAGVYANATAYKPGDVVRFGGYSYVCKLASTGNKPTDSTYFDLITEGFKWQGAWVAASIYQKGDIVSRNSNTYICITNDTTGAANAPELDPNGNYWNYIAQGGSAAQVLQTAGDLLYQAASGINRIALPAGSTGTAAEQRAASGQVLTVGGSPLLPNWETNNTTTSVFYVAETGADTNSGLQISRAFKTIRYAMDYITALTGSDKPSLTNPVSVYVKAGIYEEVLPIHVPAYVSILGDNIRTTIIRPKSGDSNMQDLALAANLTHIQLGETVSNHDGTKTAKVLGSNRTNSVEILNVTGGEWTNTDKYVDNVGNKNADASGLLTSNNEYIAWEAYHRHVANVGAVSGTEAEVKARLEAFVDALAQNVKEGSNHKVHDYGSTLLGGTAITGNNTQDTALLNYIDAISLQVIKNEDVTESAGNTKTQYINTALTATGADCATLSSTLTTLVGIITTAISNGNMSGTAKTEPWINISTATTRTNTNSTLFYVATHTIVKDLVMENLTGFSPSGGNDKDLDGSTVKGVYFKLDPASPIQKSPYIQNCSALGGAAIGALIDGDAHKHFDTPSPTPSFKSMCFDAFTQVLEGGVGFWCKGTSAAEIVSSFTYYAHISYSSTLGGRIRAVSGNSSYGKYGCISRGFDAGETTTNGTVKGLRVETDPQATKSGIFQANERITGGTSGAVGELRSDQSTTSNFIYYFPIKGTFANGELITGATSSATITTKASGAVTGQKGFLLTVAGLTAAPDQGGSVELVDNGSNNDAGSYVISSSSYTAPDGRGSLTVSRAQLGSTAAAGTGTSDVAWFNTASNTATLQTNIASGASSPFTMNVDAVTGMTIGGHLIINDELFTVNSFPSATSVTAARAQEGTTAGTHNSGATIKITSAKVATQDEVIQDFNSGATEIRVAKANIGFAATDVIKIGNEFMHITAVAADTTGLVILNFADEKVIAAGDGQSFKIRYKYSQVRLTAHDFLDVGTGNRTTTNWPFLSTQPNVPSQETDEDRPGRVYYVSTDQDGNFAVGKFFRVEQATGKATLDASAFDLTGLSSLRLGSIGAQLGAQINEFSTDGTLAQNSDEKCPTQKAVRTYVDGLSGVVGDFSVAGNLTVKGTTTTVASVNVESKDKNISLSKVATGSFTGNMASGANTITNISDTSNLAAGVVVTLTSGGGTVTLSGTVKVASLSGTTATLDAAFGGTGSATGATFGAGGPSDVVADGGGITLLGTSNKTLNWVDATDCWTSNQSFDLASTKAYRIANALIVDATTLGSSVVNSSLTSTGTLTSLTVSGVTDLQARLGVKSVTENLGVYTGGGTIDLDLSDKAIFYNSTPSSTNALNIINVPTTASKVYTVAVIFNQGGTAYGLNANVTINGANSTAIVWSGGSAPTTTANKRDVFTINIINISATATPSWVVLGSMTSFG